MIRSYDIPILKVNKVHFNLFITRFVITWFGYNTFKDGSQKCIDYTEKMTINGHFYNIIYTFLFGYNTVV